MTLQVPIFDTIGMFRTEERGATLAYKRRASRLNQDHASFDRSLFTFRHWNCPPSPFHSPFNRATFFFLRSLRRATRVATITPAANDAATSLAPISRFIFVKWYAYSRTLGLILSAYSILRAHRVRSFDTYCELATQLAADSYKRYMY